MRPMVLPKREGGIRLLCTHSKVLDRISLHCGIVAIGGTFAFRLEARHSYYQGCGQRAGLTENKSQSMETMAQKNLRPWPCMPFHQIFVVLNLRWGRTLKSRNRTEFIITYVFCACGSSIRQSIKSLLSGIITENPDMLTYFRLLLANISSSVKWTISIQSNR